MDRRCPKVMFYTNNCNKQILKYCGTISNKCGSVISKQTDCDRSSDLLKMHLLNILNVIDNLT